MLHLSNTSPVFTRTRTFFPPSDTLHTSKKPILSSTPIAVLHNDVCKRQGIHNPFWHLKGIIAYAEAVHMERLSVRTLPTTL